MNYIAIAVFGFAGCLCGAVCARWREKDLEKDVRALAERLERLERRARKCGI